MLQIIALIFTKKFTPRRVNITPKTATHAESQTNIVMQVQHCKQLTIQCQPCSEVRKNSINHQAITLLFSYCANKASSLIAVHCHDKT